MLHPSTRLRARTIVPGLALALLATLAAPGGHAQERGEKNPDQAVAAAVAEMSGAEPAEIFAASRGLDRQGASAIPAASALAEIKNSDAAKPVLEELQTEPTDRGKRAKAIIEREQLFESASKGTGLDTQGQQRLAEKKIQDLEKEVATLKKRVDGGGE